MDFFIDRGGTFTDCLAIDERGSLQVVKVLSSDRAPLEGMRQLLGLGPDDPIPACRVRMGTTLATNALLERKGQRFALLITRGFRDLLQIGTQARPELFSLAIHKPGVLYDTVLEVDARADRHGTPLVRPNRAALLDELRGLHAAGIDCIAIVVLRGDTASVDAYLTPRLARYARHDRGRAGARRARRIALLQRHARPRAVTLAAVLYVLRALVGRPIPLNSGCLGDVTVHLPERSLLNPSPGKAVAGGNVETSQRVVDVLLGALGRAAASQGTMNNVSFGQHDFGYYETIAGGAGAGPGFAGASAVHTHMTNTRITDPEVIEQRFPVRIIEFSVRRGSGGRGQYPGGDGIQREYEFLEPVTVSLLTERRLTAPFGLAGGHPGLPGRNSLNGVDLPGHASFQVVPGDRLRVETPGGGGYGSADG